MILGIDVGSVMVSVALVERRGSVLHTRYEPHYGKPRPVLSAVLGELPAGQVEEVTCTASTPAFLTGAHRYNDTVCTIRAARLFRPDAGAVLNVGGERFFLARFDPDGNYRSVRGNTSCAAGTGSFLDQQARRLGLSDSGELSEYARQNTGPRPTIASRCSVFAKTDLIHAQQEGYTLEEICDGLCYGLARNLVDTLTGGEEILEPVVFAGGVSLNRRVVDYVRELLGLHVDVGEYGYCYGAIGACREHLARSAEVRESEANAPIDLRSLISEEQTRRTYHFSPIEIGSHRQQFDGHHRFENTPPEREGNPVETDLYQDISGEASCYLGLDIGSTSTKGVLMRPHGEVIAAFYTRTAGRPIEATQAVFRTIRELERRHGIRFSILGCATTGSGRKFVGRVVGADLVLDEITAHARAAYELDPEVDTIIEIGGQDAKFTTLRHGRVTFSQMNSVCAAGTGSFLEEQAAKLDVPLSQYAEKADGARSPLASDRCTVFMERDINHYLNKEYGTSEILAAALHSVRENYLRKVASGGRIGSRISFQGATAKNHALVASFEQHLGRPIFVSRFCHVTGAVGAALVLSEEHHGESCFRGLDVYDMDIPVRTERCSFCSNHCRLRVAEVAGETVAFGFLCGRDYNTHRYVAPTQQGYDLERRRRHLFDKAAKERLPAHSAENATSRRRRGDSYIEDADNAHAARPRVGLPHALHLTVDLPFWRAFFSELGIPTVEEEPSGDLLALGKEVQQAEFCAPMGNLHGQVARLLERADYVFLPHYVGLSSQHGYCYYTQFAAPVIHGILAAGADDALITPSLGPIGPSERLRVNHTDVPGDSVEELNAALQPLFADVTAARTRKAYRTARDYVREAQKNLVAEYHTGRPAPHEDISVVITGRPYTVLDPAMNKGIPQLIADQGVKAFFHDMLPKRGRGRAPELIEETAWRYAQDILETARTCAETAGLYPVLVTSFKCSPDSFVIDFFTHIMEQADKPYLILQVDEHDSSVGYETRIEAGIRAFRNHHRVAHGADGDTPRETKAPAVHLSSRIDGRTLLIPNWDPITTPLLAANLRRHGIDARPLDETDGSIRRSMRLNTGQCVPLNIIAQETYEAMEREGLTPEQTALWMPNSEWPCNLAMYPHLLKRTFERHGAGELSVFAGDFSYVDVSPQATLGAYFAFLFGGLLRRVGCMTRPYELLPGATDRAIRESVSLLYDAFLGKARRDERIEQALELFDAIPRAEGSRPKAAIFGDLYVRDNEVFNQDLIRTIESAGGEVVTTPYSDYAKIIAGAHFKRLRRQGKYADWALYRSLLTVIEFLEKRYYERFERWVGPRISSTDPNLDEKLEAFGLRLEHTGESLDNVLKIFRLLEEHPDLALFVQASPAFCCPSLVTEAMSEKIRRTTGVPVVSVTYDGTGTPKNDMIVPYLRFAAGSAVR